MSKIVLLICYFGTLPNYTKYFVASCKQNLSCDFIIFNDKIHHDVKVRNIRFKKMSLSDFSKIATDRLGFEININWSYKLCDYKPTLGFILKEFVEGYEFWGYCDLDIIFGNIEKFVNGRILSDYDIFTTKDKWMSGSFSLYRNNNFVNGLFMTTPFYREILQADEYHNFDEVCNRWDGQARSFPELCMNNQIASIYDIVKHYEKEGKLRTHFKNIIKEWPEEITSFYLKDGKLVDLEVGEEFMYFHLLLVKRNWRFFIPDLDEIPESYYISSKGIYREKESRGIGKLIWILKIAISCSIGISKSIQTQSLFDILKKVLVEISVRKNDKISVLS